VRAVLCLAAVLLLLAAACSDSGTAKDVTVNIKITVWPKGQDAGRRAVNWRLRCNPLGGNLPHGDRACYMLTVVSRPFAPVPRDRACTQIYGGPDIAHVVGRFRGRRVDATFRRTDGCEITRWDRIAFLFGERP
jgi:hypothetical protein